MLIWFFFWLTCSAFTDIRGENGRRNYIAVKTPATVSSAVNRELDAVIHLQYGKKNEYLPYGIKELVFPSCMRL